MQKKGESDPWKCFCTCADPSPSYPCWYNSQQSFTFLSQISFFLMHLEQHRCHYDIQEKKKKSVNVNMGLWSRRPGYYSLLLWCLSAPQAPGRLYSLVSVKSQTMSHWKKLKYKLRINIKCHQSSSLYFISMFSWMLFPCLNCHEQTLVMSSISQPFPLLHCIPATPLKRRQNLV